MSVQTRRCQGAEVVTGQSDRTHRSMVAVMWSAEGSAAVSASNGRSSEASAERWLGMAGGIAFGVLTFIGWAFWAGPHLPELNAAPARIGAWYAQHAGAARAGVFCGILALLPFMGFVVA